MERNGQRSDARELECASELPALNGATSYVTVAENTADNSAMHLDRSVWFKGMDVRSVGFQTTADAGCSFWLGSLGLATPASQTFRIGAPLMLTAEQEWAIGSGGQIVVDAAVSSLTADETRILGTGSVGILELNVAAPHWGAPVVVSNLNVQFNAAHALGPKVAPFATIYHHATGMSPTYADGVTIDRNL